MLESLLTAIHQCNNCSMQLKFRQWLTVYMISLTDGLLPQQYIAVLCTSTYICVSSFHRHVKSHSSLHFVQSH